MYTPQPVSTILSTQESSNAQPQAGPDRYACGHPTARCPSPDRYNGTPGSVEDDR